MFRSIIAVTVFALSASALHIHPHRLPPPPPPDSAANTSAPLTKTYYFDQLIDHLNPSLGTFKQRYFFNDTFWRGQGSPIVLSNPGEQSADGFDGDLTSKNSLQNALMQSLGAAGVVMEHRSWGQSSPYQLMTTSNMTYLSVDQAIEDARYFVQNVKLPWTTSNATNSHPDVVPWVNMGCSYPGVLSAYVQESYPDIFAAGWASSAPVQAVSDFWQYFEPIEEGMPKNCSSDVALAVKTIDQILLHGNDTAKLALKTSFGAEKLADDDFASAIISPVYDWQEMSAGSYARSGEDPFFQFCDAMETFPNGTLNTSPIGVGLPTILDTYASVFKSNYSEAQCGVGAGGACMSTYNYTEDYYTNKSVDNNGDLQWLWMVCTEFGYWQDGDPGNYSSIVSSLVTVDYSLRQCNHLFPKADGTPGRYHSQTVLNNLEHEGWNLRADRLFVVNGQFDPWRSASLSSIWAPQFRNTPHMEVEVVKNGHHCWDWNVSGAKYEPDIRRVVDLGAVKVKAWLKEWYARRPYVKNVMPAGGINWDLILGQ